MLPRIQPTLDIIDEGLRLYRRGFFRFLLVASVWCVPVILAVGISFATVYTWGEDTIVLIMLLWLVLAIPLALVFVASLSRATLAVQQNQPVRLRETIAILPQQFVGMGCYSVVFALFAQIVTSFMTFLCFCPISLVFMVFSTSIGAALEDSGTLGTGLMILMSVVSFLLILIVYSLMLIVSGASYSSLIYAIQPFILEKKPFGMTIAYSINLVFYRFGQNAIAFALTSVIFAALAVIVSIAIGVLLPMPLFWSLGSESPIAQGSSALAWLFGLIVVLPPLPIWMVLLYQRNTAAREGISLAQRIVELEP